MIVYDGQKNPVPLIWNSRSPLGSFSLECKDPVDWPSYHSRQRLVQPFSIDNPVNK